MHTSCLSLCKYIGIMTETNEMISMKFHTFMYIKICRANLLAVHICLL